MTSRLPYYILVGSRHLDRLGFRHPPHEASGHAHSPLLRDRYFARWADITGFMLRGHPGLCCWATSRLYDLPRSSPVRRCI